MIRVLIEDTGVGIKCRLKEKESWESFNVELFCFSRSRAAGLFDDIAQLV